MSEYIDASIRIYDYLPCMCNIFEMQYFRFESFSSSSNSTLPLFAPFSMISFYNFFFERTLGQGQYVLSYLLCFSFFSIPFNAYFIFLPHRVSIVMNIKAVYNSFYTKKGIGVLYFHPNTLKYGQWFRKINLKTYDVTRESKK